MALFKVMRGAKSRLNAQEKSDGYAWYTEDDAGFYIDAKDSGNVVRRKKINDAENVSIDVNGIASTNVKDAILEVNKTLTYTSQTKTLTLS